MTNKHQHNPAIYISLLAGSFFISFLAIIVASLASYYSFTGALYNPLFRIPAWAFNSVIGRHVLPYSTRDFVGLGGLTEYYGLVDTLLSVIYLVGAFGITFILTNNVILHLANQVFDYVLRYKLGDKGAAAFKKEQLVKSKIKSEEVKSISDLETARRAHYEQWKKYHKSSMTYYEWRNRHLD